MASLADGPIQRGFSLSEGQRFSVFLLENLTRQMAANGEAGLGQPAELALYVWPSGNVSLLQFSAGVESLLPR